jgi:hypothetical protein
MSCLHHYLLFDIYFRIYLIQIQVAKIHKPVDTERITCQLLKLLKQVKVVSKKKNTIYIYIFFFSSLERLLFFRVASHLYS